MLRATTAEYQSRKELEQRFAPLIREDLSFSRQVSYVANKNEPFLRWYRFKEAFGAQFVRRMFEVMRVEPTSYVFDPWSGMGTTCFVSERHGVPSIGIDSLPLAVFVARTLTNAHQASMRSLRSAAERVEADVSKMSSGGELLPEIPIIRKAFSPQQIAEIIRWRKAISGLEPGIVRDILKLVLMTVIQDISMTAQDGQFLRLLETKKHFTLRQTFKMRMEPVLADIAQVQLKESSLAIPAISEWDVRDLANFSFPKAPTHVITSPPYLNRYDYSRSYVLQLALWFINSHAELKDIRFRKLLRSHIESKVADTEKPNHHAVQEILGELSLKELNNPRIPYMIQAYFNDMEKSINGLSQKIRSNGQVTMVVDNARYEGEHVPTDLILSDIAEKCGFRVDKIVVARYKGNSSQQMGRYGTHPLRESIMFWTRK